MLAIIDYGYGNIHSVAKALEHIGVGEILITDNAKAVESSDHIVLPGVGAFAQCMGGLSAVDGMIEVIKAKVLSQNTPFLGICVGMQLLADVGKEFETTEGLGFISGEVTRIEPKNHNCKIPHMGWNNVTHQGNKIFQNAWGRPQEDVYFVHSYAFRAKEPKDIAATCEYGADSFAAAIAKDNIFGVQFHPEKSQKAGLALLKSWYEKC